MSGYHLFALRRIEENQMIFIENSFQFVDLLKKIFVSVSMYKSVSMSFLMSVPDHGRGRRK